MRTEDELLVAFESATKENPLILEGNEVDFLTQIFKKKNEREKVKVDYQIMPRFPEYKSQIDGRMITDRAQHREHLHSNGATEIGNEYDKHIKNLKEQGENYQAIDMERTKDDSWKKAVYDHFNR